jgi:cytochrome c-type biogenesis protein CcmE
MKPKHQRLLFISLACIIIAALAFTLMRNIEEYIVYFYAPSDIAANPPQQKTFIRVGGMVKQGSVAQQKNTLYFTLTDYAHEVDVVYTGLVPALFREDQGIVAEGYFNGTHLNASTILAKHDENYMPPEVAKTLKNDANMQIMQEGWKADAAKTMQAE